MNRGSRYGAVAAVCCAGVVLAACGVGASADPAQGSASPPAPASLRILVTNDDGWNAPGITALREALRGAGHTVVEVAPATDQSGTGAALTLGGPLAVSRPTADPDVWSVGGRPADATAVGLRSIMQADPPDLVVSGINSGNNVSVSAIHSGTVGAAMTAVELGVPAVAVSGPSARAGDTDPAQYRVAAEFTARLVAELAKRPVGTPLLPAKSVLNVNYPKVDPGAVATGVSAVPTSDRPLLDLRYEAGPAGTLVPRVGAVAATGGDDDAGVVARGGVALTDLSGDPDTAVPGVAARLASVLKP